MNQISTDDWRQFKLARLLAIVILVVAPAIYLYLANMYTKDIFAADEQAKLIMYLLIPIAMIDPALWFLIRRFIVKSLTQREPDRSAAKQYFGLVNIKLSLVAAIFVYGMVVFFLTNDMMNMTWFYLIGAVWTFLFWPKRTQFERVMNEGLEVL